ncbi:hypothetical protein [Thalassolituus pacificus]|uniref:Uncharacterized protein n=1 Tax=Thalassolituus pacificus TaxID=2975440 RepID=A0A9X2WII8_9GAMM|nr:hypothetical protein [Thalassolituus pacificus]MCT7361003.1 hypothetical protein [Thalassolituus pacificus]
MPSSASTTKKTPCKFCQRSRWLMTITILVVLFSVAFLNLSG